MGRFSALPVDVFPLVACVAAGTVFMAHSAYRTIFHCGEVQYVSLQNPCVSYEMLMWLLSTAEKPSLTNRTRADELQDQTDDASEKSKVYYKNSMYMQLGKMFKSDRFNDKSLTWDPSFTKPEDRPV